MLDATGNNIANVNTSGFKSSSVQFQDTLSQMTQGGTAPADDAAGGNPAQVGLGVQVAGITTNFAQGAAQNTGRSSDMMIAGDGFFVTRNGNANSLTRAGAFDFDANGRLVSPDGGIVQGWMADNAGNLATGGALSDIALPKGMLSPGSATTAATMEGNLPKEAAPGEQLVREIEISQPTAPHRCFAQLHLHRQRLTVANSDGTGATTALAQQPDGSLTGPATTAFKGVNVNLSGLTGYAELRTVSIANQNGRAAGTLESFTLGADGSLTGAFSNGTQQVVAQIALGNVTNPAGLQKNGGSSYR